MSEDRSSNEQKSWLNKLTQAFAHEPRNRQELLEVLREAHQNKLLDSEALAIVEAYERFEEQQDEPGKGQPHA